MIQEREITGNITVSYIPMDKFKTTTIGLYIHRPLNKDDAAKNALIAQVLRQGSENYPSLDKLTKRLDSLYGAKLASGIGKKGEDHIILFEAECISDRYAKKGEKLLKELIEVILDVVFKPYITDGGFCESIFSQEQKNLIDSIRASINDKRVYAHERLCEITCEGTPYAVARLGDEESAKKLDRISLYTYYQDIIRSSKIDIYVAGSCDIDAVAGVIKNAVNSQNEKPCKISKTAVLEPKKEVKKVTEHMDVTQGKIAVSFTTGIMPDDERYWALLVANSIYGAGAHSKLFNNVREKLSLAYYAGSQMHKFKGFIAVNAGVEFSNFDKAYDEILVQLDELKKGNVTDHEFNSAKMSLINNLKSYYDDQLYMQNFYLGEKVAGTNYDIDYYIDKISSVSLADAVSVADSIKLNSVYYLAGKTNYKKSRGKTEKV